VLAQRKTYVTCAEYPANIVVTHANVKAQTAIMGKVPDGIKNVKKLTLLVIIYWTEFVVQRKLPNPQIEFMKLN
jgi:hypothetical protein